MYEDRVKRKDRLREKEEERLRKIKGKKNKKKGKGKGKDKDKGDSQLLIAADKKGKKGLSQFTVGKGLQDEEKKGKKGMLEETGGLPKIERKDRPSTPVLSQVSGSTQHGISEGEV